MRFSILRRFSHLIHRRTKSDPLVLSDLHLASPLDTLTRTRSLSHIADHSFPASILPTIDPPVPLCEKSREELCEKITSANLRIFELETKISQLEAENAVLRFNAELRDEELAVFQGDLFSERSNSAKVKREMHAAIDIAKVSGQKMEQYEKYFDVLRDVGLGESLVDGPYQAMSAGGDGEEALVESVRAAALDPQSGWSRILPAVIGPRTQQEYISSINSLLKARKETREVRKATRFWKRLAKQQKENSDIITPSASNISDVTLESIGPARRQAVNDLLAKLRSGTIPLRGRIVPQGISISASDSIEEPSLLPYLNSASSQLSSLVPSLRAVSMMPSISSGGLAPLASQIFKRQLMASHSSERFSFRQLRPILGNSDAVDREDTSSYVASHSQSSIATSSGSEIADENAPSYEKPLITRLSVDLSPDVFGPAQILSTFDPPSSSSAYLGTIPEESPSDAEAETTSYTSHHADVDKTLVEEPCPAPAPAPVPILEKKTVRTMLSRLPRRLSLAMSPPRNIKLPNDSKPISPPRSLLQPTISSSLKAASAQQNLKPVLPLRIQKKNKKPVTPKGKGANLRRSSLMDLD